MKITNVDNVNGALGSLVELMNKSVLWRYISPREGKVTKEFTLPVTTVYTNPQRRVLFSEKRDANPFFHLMESLWMLAGRNDSEWISRFSSNIAQFAEDNGRFYGAYGHRWRYHFGFDQLSSLIRLLESEPDTRRAVLAMWDPFPDLASPMAIPKRDLPCNTTVYFKVREGELHMTVCCRSNDAVWGAYGANAVHFSVLQEYVATALDVEMGPYTHVSDNFHVYMDNPFVQKIEGRWVGWNDACRDLYYAGSVHPVGMIDNFERWNSELAQFMRHDWADPVVYGERFFRHTALPMRMAWEAYKNGDVTSALEQVRGVAAPDWRRACHEWLKRRENRE